MGWLSNSQRDIFPDDPRIHYSASDGRENYGRKMNRYCLVAAGDSCVVTDDDYLYPQDRLEKLATGLLGGEKVVVADTPRVVVNHIVTMRAGGDPYNTGRKTATENSTFAKSRV